MAGGTHTLQERYSKLLLAKLRKTTVIASLFNNRYEGTPTAGAVKIPVRDTEVKVKDYNIKTGADMDTSATTYETLNIDKDKAVNELIDGYEASAVPDNLVADRLDSAGYSMGVYFDTACIDVAKAGSGVAEGNTTPLEPSTIYANIVKTVAKAKKMGLAPNEMWLAVSNETFANLLLAPEFIKASALGDAVVQNGFVGRIAGIDVYETNNFNDEDNIEYILGNRVFCHFVDEWSVPLAVKDLMDGKHIGASALQGRRVYGVKLSRPTTVFVKKKA